MTENTIEEIPGENIVSLGQLLKETREKKGYTLSYVTEMTRINRGVLQSIENGDLEGGPGPVFIRGFIRTYARLVGIEDQKIQELLNTVPELKSGNAPAPIRDIGLQESAEGWGWKKYAVLLLLIIALGGGYAFIRFPNFFSSTASEVSVVETPEIVEEVNLLDDLSETKTPLSEDLVKEIDSVLPEEELPMPPAPLVEARVPLVEKENNIPKAYHLLLTIKAKELTWVGIIIDEELGQEILLQPGEKIEKKAKDRYQLTLSHTKNVEIQFNGRTLDIDRSTDLLTSWVISKSMLEE